MNWPTHTDYQDAIQNPAICFQEADLKAGTATCDMLGLPRVMSGNFASVYELTTEGKRYAVRCFVRQVMGQQGRYARLCEHLSKIKLPWLVNFDYYLKGILVRGEWFPIVKMDWVQGAPINTWIDENINNPDKLKSIAAQFRTLVKDMREHKLAHGDYQHGNIMVTLNDELRLVDYDGMYCPAFGKGRSPELGHANFQHPRRLAENYDETIDNFSALVLYMSLLALADEPALWKEFYTVDNLILTSGDYKNPQNSKALARLIASKNPVVKQLALLVQSCAMRSVTDVPWFEESVVEAEKGTLEAQVAAMPKPGEQSDSWLSDTGAKAEGSRAAQPQMSRPAQPQMSRPAVGTTATPKPTTPSVGGGSRPSPSQHTTPPYQSSHTATHAKPPAEEEKSGLSKVIIAVTVGIIVLLIIIIALKPKTPAPAPDPAPAGQQ